MTPPKAAKATQGREWRSQMTNLIDLEIDRFLAEKAQEKPRCGRLIFALDATASRQETWDTACQLQANMFREVSGLGSLATQLVYYRGADGHPEGECRASRWYDNSAYLTKAMSSIACRAGYTQLKRVLQHCCRQAAQSKVNAVIFVGDACEEPRDILTQLVADLGCLKVPVFIFQEGHNPKAEQVFRKIARLTGGAYCRFDRGAAKQLSELLKAVALFAVGGAAALEGRNDAGSVRLIAQLK
jgi:hypothetical protein